MAQLPNDSDPVDDLLGLLRDKRRRFVIYYLRNHAAADPVQVDTLASAIAAMEVAGARPWTDATPSTDSALERAAAGEAHERDRSERVLISLVHTHLPKLHETGVVEFDPAAGTVRATHPPAEFWERLRSYQQFSARLAATGVD